MPSSHNGGQATYSTVARIPQPIDPVVNYLLRPSHSYSAGENFLVMETKTSTSLSQQPDTRPTRGNSIQFTITPPHLHGFPKCALPLRITKFVTKYKETHMVLIRQYSLPVTKKTVPATNTVSSAICVVILYKDYISDEVLIHIIKTTSTGEVAHYKTYNCGVYGNKHHHFKTTSYITNYYLK
jgi:hypothetical protein